MNELNDNLKQITVCEVCGNPHLEPVIDLGLHAMCDDLVEVGDNRQTIKYPINILFCNTCKTAHQEYQIEKKVLFPKTYHYRAALTKDVLNGMRELVDSCKEKIGDIEGKKVLDIGCNDGSLLSIFKELGAQTYGIEPTNAALDAKKNGHTVLQDFFSETAAQEFANNFVKPDIITFTNVFAHIENLNDVLAGLKKLIASDTYLVIENHYLGAVLELNQFDTFYHEHPRTYSYTSFKYIAENLGANISHFEFPKRYGGNIRVFISKSIKSSNESGLAKETLDLENTYLEGCHQLSKKTSAWKSKKRHEILEKVAHEGKLRAKAFPGRAAIILELLGLTEEHISAVYEQPGSPKVGCYIPGTRIPIVSDDDFDNNNKAPVINLAWHIHDEIQGYLESNGFEGDVIPVISQDDF